MQPRIASMLQHHLDTVLVAARGAWGGGGMVPGSLNDRAGWDCCPGSTPDSKKEGHHPGRSPAESKKKKDRTPAKSKHAEGWVRGAPDAPPPRVDTPAPLTQSGEYGPRGKRMPSNPPLWG